MTSAWCVAALAMAGLGIAVRGRARLLGQALIYFGGVGLIGVIFLQLRQNVFVPQAKPSDRCAMAVSYCLANCLLRDVAGEDGNVVLLFPSRRRMNADLEQSYEDGFVPPLRHGRAKLKLKALRLEGAGHGAATTLAAFKQALGQIPAATAIISYAGVPAGLESLFGAAQPGIPRFYVYDPDRTSNWVEALKVGRVRAVVLPRPGVNPSEGVAMADRPEAIFDRFFMLVTPDSADQVAAQLGKRQP